MDLRNRFNSIRIFKDLLRRLPIISKRNRETESDPEKIKIIRGLALLFFSMILGFVSLQATNASSVARYRSDHWPNRSTFKLVLNQYGIEEHENIGDYSRELQTNPEAFSGEQTLWITEDGCLVHLPASPYRDRSAELWACKQPPKTPTRWIRIGSGIGGFESLVQFLEKIPKKSEFRGSRRLNIVDPKEIRY